jgi:hypothetical protein
MPIHCGVAGKRLFGRRFVDENAVLLLAQRGDPIGRIALAQFSRTEQDFAGAGDDDDFVAGPLHRFANIFDFAPMHGGDEDAGQFVVVVVNRKRKLHEGYGDVRALIQSVGERGKVGRVVDRRPLQAFQEPTLFGDDFAFTETIGSGKHEALRRHEGEPAVIRKGRIQTIECRAQLLGIGRCRRADPIELRVGMDAVINGGEIAVHTIGSRIRNLDHLAADQPSCFLAADIGGAERDREGNEQAKAGGGERDLLAHRQPVLKGPDFAAQLFEQFPAPFLRSWAFFALLPRRIHNGETEASGYPCR